LLTTFEPQQSLLARLQRTELNEITVFNSYFNTDAKLYNKIKLKLQQNQTNCQFPTSNNRT